MNMSNIKIFLGHLNVTVTVLWFEVTSHYVYRQSPLLPAADIITINMIPLNFYNFKEKWHLMWIATRIFTAALNNTFIIIVIIVIYNYLFSDVVVIIFYLFNSSLQVLWIWPPQIYTKTVIYIAEYNTVWIYFIFCQ